MFRDGLDWLRRFSNLLSLVSRRTVTLSLCLAVAVACGGAGPAKSVDAAKASEETPAGVPVMGDEGWCDPMPDLGESCTTDLKECTIVCDYISDTCAALVCMGGLWEYVERGEQDDE